MKAGVLFLIFLLSVTQANAFKKRDHRLSDSLEQEALRHAQRLNDDPVMEVETPSFDLPFTVVGGLILVKAKVDSVEGNFVFDTGAPYLVLNKTYFREVERLHNQDDEQSGITGGAGWSEKAKVGQLRLGSFRYYKIMTDLVNLGPIENIRGVKILGLLGMNLFHQCEVMVDYANGLLHLQYVRNSERKSYRHPLLATSRYEEHEFDYWENRILVKAQHGRKKLQFVVDYAAESNVLDSRLSSSIIDSVRITSRIVLAGTGSKKTEAIKGELDGVQFGDTTCTLQVILTSLANTCFATNSCINGVLGFEFLSRRRLIFNFVTRKLYVLK